MASINNSFSNAAMDKSTFAEEWCTRFVTLTRNLYDKGPQNIEKNFSALEQNNAVFHLEAGLRGLTTVEFGRDLSLREAAPRLLPWEDGFRWTNPFIAAAMSLEFGKKMKKDVDAGKYAGEKEE